MLCDTSLKKGFFVFVVLVLGFNVFSWLSKTGDVPPVVVSEVIAPEPLIEFCNIRAGSIISDDLATLVHADLNPEKRHSLLLLKKVYSWRPEITNRVILLKISKGGHYKLVRPIKEMSFLRFWAISSDVTCVDGNGEAEYEL